MSIDRCGEKQRRLSKALWANYYLSPIKPHQPFIRVERGLAFPASGASN